MFRPPWFESLLYLWWGVQLDVRKDNSNITGRFRMFILRDDCSKWHVCNNSPICFRQIILARHQNEIPLDYIFNPFIYYNCQDCECNHLRIFNLHSASVNHLRSWLCSFCRWDIPGTLNYRSLSTPRTFQLKNTTFFQERNNWKLTPGKFWLVPGKPTRPHHIDCQGSSGLKFILLCLETFQNNPLNYDIKNHNRL